MEKYEFAANAREGGSFARIGIGVERADHIVCVVDSPRIRIRQRRTWIRLNLVAICDHFVNLILPGSIQRC